MKGNTINPELLIIKLLLYKEIYNRYKEYISLDSIKESYRELYYIYNTLNTLQEKYNRDISLEELVLYFYTLYPDSDKVVYSLLFSQLEKADIPQDSAEDMVNQIVSRKHALKLSELAFQVGQGLKPREELEEFLQKTPKQPETLPLEAVTTDLEALLNKTYQEQGLRWRLDCLNKSLGSLRKGDFGFIFARPETGKTTFLASEITNMLEQGASVCWFNNEEDGWKVYLRIYQAFFGVTSDVILSNVRHYRDLFNSVVLGRFNLFDSATISRSHVERIIGRLEPGLVIYDQIDKIKGFSNDREDLRLGSIYQWARELAKGRHAAIGVCQADGSAEGVRYLTMEHVANAKTAKQAEADFILGIGKAGDANMEMARFLSLPKNKLLGDPDSISDLRHGRLEVLIEPQVARYRDVLKFN